MGGAGVEIKGVESGEDEAYEGGIHTSDTGARRLNIPYGIALGAQLEGVLAKLVTNWMGDDGFVKRLDFQSRRIWIFGHLAWLKGKVARKYVENDEALVDLEIWAENQDGLVLMPGSATVRLSSRKNPAKPFEIC